MSGRQLSYAAVSVLHAIADGVAYGFDVMALQAVKALEIPHLEWEDEGAEVVH